MKVLLVVDMQNDFVDGSLGTKEAQTILPNVVKRISESRGELILFTKDTHSEYYLQTQEGGNLPVEHCIAQTNGWRIHKDVREAWLNNKTTIVDSQLHDNTLYKDTFGSKELVNYLEKLDSIEELEIIGLCTDVCVISNALLIKAFQPELKITVDADCCAGVTPESHDIALKAMKMCQIYIVNSEI